MRQSKYVNSDKGFGLVQILIVLGIVSTFSVVMASTVTSIRKDTRLLEQKYEMMDLALLIASTYSDTSVCTCALQAGLGFNENAGNNDRVMQFPNGLLSDCDTGSQPLAAVGAALHGTASLPNGSHSDALQVSTIKMVHIDRTSNPNEFSGELQISFKDNGSEIARKPITIIERFLIDPNSPRSARRVAACTGQGPVPPPVAPGAPPTKQVSIDYPKCRNANYDSNSEKAAKNAPWPKTIKGINLVCPSNHVMVASDDDPSKKKNQGTFHSAVCCPLKY